MSKSDDTKTKATKSTTKKAPSKAKSSKPKAARKKKAPAKSKTKSKPTPKAGLRLPWAEVVSRVMGEPAQSTTPAPEPLARPEPAAPKAAPTTIRFPSPAPRKASPVDTFGPDEWVSVTYTGEEVFVHGKAGIFARGTTTHLRGKLARELADKPGFRVRRAA